MNNKTLKLSLMLCILSTAILSAEEASSSMDVVDVQNAWSQYPSANPKDNSAAILLPESNKMEIMLADDLKALQKQKLDYLHSVAAKRLEGSEKTDSAWLDVGVLYAQNEFFSEACGYFDKCLAINPENADAYNNLGNIAYLSGKLDDAIAAYNKALEIRRNDAMTLLNLAFLHFEKGSFKLAKKYYRKAIYINPALDRKEYQIIAANKDASGGNKASNAGVKEFSVRWSAN